MPRRLGILVGAALTTACGSGPIPGGDDEVGDTTSTSSETSTSEGFSTDDTDEGPMDCGGFSLVSESVPSNLMLVVDTSSSMVLETWDHDADPLTPEVTRWSSARALIELLVAEFGSSMYIGVQRFPSTDACPEENCTDADVCLIAALPEVAVGAEQGTAILETLPPADADTTTIVGGSPASAGFLAARDHLVEQLVSVPSGVVLITDGGANCSEGLSLPESFEIYDDSLAGNVGDAFQFDSITTWVVGVDIDIEPSMAGEDSPQQIDAFAALNEVALSGGIPWHSGMESQKFYDVRDSEDLIDAMQRRKGLVECTVDLTMVPDGPPAPQQIPLVTIEIDGVEVPRVEDCEAQDGWAWIIEGEILTFCGPSCELFFEADEIEGDYGCPPP